MFEKKKGKRKIMKVIVATNGVDNKPLLGELNWHERAAFQRSAFGRSTADSDVVATILISLFSSPLLAFFTEDVLGSKNLFCESCL